MRHASQARGVPAIEGDGSAASIEGLRPYEDWLCQCFYPLPVPAINEPPMKGSYTLPEFVKKTKATRFCAMILDEEGARCAAQARGVPAIEGCGSAASIEGLRPYEDWLCQYFYPLLNPPNRKRTSHMRGSYTLPEFVPKNQASPIWRNDFGCGASIRKPLRARVVFDIRERS